MNWIQRIETSLLTQAIRQQWSVGRICFAIVVQSAIFVGIYRLLLRAKLGGGPEVIFLSEGLLVLIVAPYLLVSTLATQFKTPDTQFETLSLDELLLLSPTSSRSFLWRSIIVSQLPSICFLILSTLVLAISIPLIAEIPRTKILLLHLVFGVYIFSSAAIGALGWRIFCNQIFATELAYFIGLLLTGSVFLLSSVERYLDNVQSIIPPFLHLNPLIAVCHLLRIDIFRTPYLYELTPIPSYLFVYPPWYIVCGWQALIGIGCFVLASKPRLTMNCNSGKL